MVLYIGKYGNFMLRRLIALYAIQTGTRDNLINSEII